MTRTELHKRRSAAMRQRIRAVLTERRIAQAQPADDPEPEPRPAS